VFAQRCGNKGRSPNGDAVMFNSIEIFVSFSSIWYVCVVVGRRITVWQGSCQVKCARRKSRGAMAEGSATVQMNSVVFLAFSHRGGCGRLVFRSLSRMEVQENLLCNVLRKAKFLSKVWLVKGMMRSLEVLRVARNSS
jgi:hypothetical protein